MLQMLFTSKNTTVTACRVKTEGAKTGLLFLICSSMTMINESLTLQPLSMHRLYPGSMNTVLEGVAFFSDSVLQWS